VANKKMQKNVFTPVMHQFNATRRDPRREVETFHLARVDR